MSGILCCTTHFIATSASLTPCAAAASRTSLCESSALVERSAPPRALYATYAMPSRAAQLIIPYGSEPIPIRCCCCRAAGRTVAVARRHWSVRTQ